VGILGFFAKLKAPAPLQIGAWAKRTFAIFALFLMIPNTAFALTEQEARDELNRINRENQQLSDQVDLKNQQIGTYSEQVAALNYRISRTQAEINLANARITTLNSQIKITENKIKAEEEKLKIRQGQLGILIKEMYEDGQLSPIEVIARSGSFSEYVNRSEYLEQVNFKIKGETDKIITIQKTLRSQRQAMAENKKGIEKSRKEALAKRADLATQRSIQRDLLSMTSSQKTSYEKEISGNNARKGVLYCIIYGCNKTVDGDIVVTNSYSPYYSQLNYSMNYVESTSPWNNNKLWPGVQCWDCTIKNYGCLITSLSMVRSYFGKPTTPTTEAKLHTYTIDGYMKSWDFAGKARVRISKSQIATKLNQGKPVIVELDLGAYHHFIALFGISGDTFYANDPAFGINTTYSLASQVVNAYSY
jgi:peptidoglycan hydrolase CwlO-like protein